MAGVQGSIPLTNLTLAELEKATQLLKQEWQKSKDEAATGKKRSKSGSGTTSGKV
ncbi:hypothetical protein [Variovorax sp. 160MFSha2.1]|uniref:hypothetical protein n=1 Tax=Variovorax sp. 160MFSha2.1 TaxID=3158367 RepID=UPI003AAE5732